MTQSEKLWLKNTFIVDYFSIDAVLTDKVLGAYYEAERILTGEDKIRKRGCKCELPDLKKYVTMKFKQFLQDELHRGVHNK